MKAAILSAYGLIDSSPLELRDDVEQPKPGENDLLVRIKACGICRTDLHVIEGELQKQRLPIIPGHQVVGVIERLGARCKQFTIGDRVGIAWLRHTCGTCAWCKSDQENLCESSRYTGYHENGGFAEYAVVPEDFAYKLAEPLSDTEVAPLLCAGTIGYRALKRSALKRGGRLALYGFGSSAHLTLQVALAWNCEVYVITREETHRKLARSLGAKWAGDLNETPPVQIDSAIIFAPAGNLVPPALRAVRKGGTVALAGIHMSAVPEMTYNEHLFHEKVLTSIEANTRSDGEEFLKLAAEIPIRPKVVTYPLAEANRALQDLKHGKIEGTGVLLI